ncbi:MAG: helix-turn-helix domain-containing protein [Planctomycetota bacterium]
MPSSKSNTKASESRSLGQKVIDRLGDLDAALDKSEQLKQRFTLRKVKLDLEPQAYDAKRVKEVREKLGVSQAILAQLLGASVNTVQSWESGKKTPGGMASRFLDEMERDPEHWLERLAESVV